MKTQRIKQSIFILTIILGFTSGLQAQSPARISKTPFNRFSIGLRASHLYDFKFKPNKDLTNGFIGEDMQGLNGEGTRFDMSFGLDLAYFFTPLFSLDLGYDMGKMTGSGEREYYQSDVTFLTLGANFALKRANRIAPYRFVPYTRFSIGRGTYDVDRFFKEDNQSFSNTTGACLQTAFGLGFRYHISEKVHINMMSEFVANYTDEWDGFNYSSGNDHILRTTFGVRYTFGKSTHVDRRLAWQDRRVDDLSSASNTETLDKALKALSDSLRIMNERLTQVKQELNDKMAYDNADTDQDGVLNRNDICPNVYGLAIYGGCPDTAKVKTTDDVAPGASTGRVKAQPRGGNTNAIPANLNEIKKMLIIELSNINFASGRAILDEKAKAILNKNAKVLLNNPNFILVITGHTDHEGNSKANLRLSGLRAAAVRDYLIKQGVPASQLEVQSAGETNLLSNGTDREDKALNRRVEFEVKMKE
ncbi:MAG: OmpA family protein [Bacteroidia bacterium]|jgi:outer membrane protein OmpA-like peptidoglycan-associated protein|nr:OmpA family protein [Bacteroidia bacterium]